MEKNNKSKNNKRKSKYPYICKQNTCKYNT